MKKLKLESHEVLPKKALTTIFGGYGDNCDEGVTIYCNKSTSWEATSCDRKIADLVCEDEDGPNRCA